MKDSIGDRFKEYENCFKQFLPRNSWVIMRIDGRSFHSYTRGLNKPFDYDLIKCMQHTATELCKNISCCKLAYTQSDEISLILYDGEKAETEPFFGNNLNKLISISASIASNSFNKFRVDQYIEHFDKNGIIPTIKNVRNVLQEFKQAQFDSRCFIVPNIDEVINYLIWRQQDATRNSIQMVAQSLYSHKELQRKNSNELQEMIFQKEQNWNDLEPFLKRGTVVCKNIKGIETGDGDIVSRSIWTAILDIPVFTQEREFIKNIL